MTPLLNAFAPMRVDLRSRLFREYRTAGKGGQFAKGGGRVPGKGGGNVPAAVSREEAEAWAAGSALPGPLYHGTSAAAAIREDGFELRPHRPGAGNVVEGVYLSENLSVAQGYARFENGEVVEARAKVRRVASHAETFQAAATVDTNLPAAEYAHQVTAVLRAQGFDAARFGKDEVIVFDPAALKPIKPSEDRAAGKGGQFAKGGGRVPGKGAVESPRGEAVKKTFDIKSKMSENMARELVARPGLVADGGRPPTAEALAKARTPGRNPLSKGWANEVKARAAAEGHPVEGAAGSNAVRGAAKAQIVKDLSGKLVKDQEFHDAVDAQRDMPLNRSYPNPSYEAMKATNKNPDAYGIPPTVAERSYTQALLQRSARTPESQKILKESIDAVNKKYGSAATNGHLMDELASRGVPVRTAIARGLVQQHVDQWAGTSGDSSPPAVAAQLSAGLHHGSPLSPLKTYGRADSVVKDATQLLPERDSLHRAYLRAEYEHTQEYLASKGITEVTVQRGHRAGKDEVLYTAKTGDTVRVESNPLTSWSTSEAVANRFSAGSYAAESRLLATTVPAHLVQSTAVTGRGCLNEFEVLLIGSPNSEALVVRAGYK